MDRNKEYTCIFGGGAIRGFAYIGAIKALEELDIKIKTVAGSSVGAIFAGLIAVGYTPKEIEEVLMNINFELFKDIPLLITKDMAKPGVGTLSNRMLYFQDRLLAKTGTLTNVSAVAGYIKADSGKKDKFDCLVINTGSIIIVDFNTSEAKRKNLIEQGYKQTLKYFEDTLKLKKQSLYEHYEKLYLFLLKFRRALKLKKFNVAKDEISMFYLKHFSTVSEYIDKDFVNELENIKNEFLSGYSISLLFRVPSLNNDRKILSDTELYLQEISQHIDDLKKYIEN